MPTPHKFTEKSKEEWYVCTECDAPVYDAAHRNDGYSASVTEAMVDKATVDRHAAHYTHLEMMCAAYLLKTRIPPDEVELATVIDTDGTRHFYRRRRPFPGEPINQ